MKLALAMVVAVAASVACAALGPSVPLLTDDGSRGPGCYTNHATGLLVANPNHGTDFQVDGWTVPATVMWPQGYTAHRDGAEVAVVNPVGLVVAVTGRRYQIDGGSLPDQPAWLACGDVKAQ